MSHSRAMANKRKPPVESNEPRERGATVRVAQKKNAALFTTVERSRLMSRVRQKNTAPEVAVRQVVYSLGFRFRVGGKGLPGRPDLVNRKSRWAIFVHGCYWHAHEGCRLWKIPTENHDVWKKKFEDNRDRDRKNISDLEILGYRVLVIWMCEIPNRDALTVRLSDFLSGRKLGTVSESYCFVESGNRIARQLTVHSKETTTLQDISATEGSVDPRAAFDQGFLRGMPRLLPELRDPPIRLADLFCGCGGLSLGVREACWAVGRSFESVLAVDHDASALSVYQRNFSPLRTADVDLETLLDRGLGAPPSKVELDWLKDIGDIDVLVAGPPCQGHSDLNNQTRRSDPRNGLYERVGRFVELVRPAHVLIENVPGVVHDRQGTLARTAEHLTSLGYRVDQGVVDLVRLGVPQRRKRHVLVASLAGLVRLETVLERHVSPSRSVDWAIRDLENRSANGLLDTASRPSLENLERIRWLLENDEYDLPNPLRPLCHRNDDHSYKSMYGRLSWAEPAQTITSGFGSPGQGRFLHPSQPRTLTPREAARLQFFPDTFFDGVEKRSALAQMIGNAVPMKLSWAFCSELLALDSAG